MYRTLALCSNHGAYEALPEPPRPIDLAAARRRLEAEGIPVVDARVMLLAALEVEVTIGRTGRLLFKTRDAALAESTFARLRRLLDLEGAERAAESPAQPSRKDRTQGAR